MQRGGAIAASQLPQRVQDLARWAAQFSEGFFVPVSPGVPTLAGSLGAVTKSVADWYQERQK